MTSPDRDPRVLNHPDLKVTPGMLAAFDIATDYAEAHPGVNVRIIDADVLLEPRPATRRAPRDVVEVFIDTAGVMVVGTGADSLRPVYRAFVPLPGGATAQRAFEALLEFHGAWAARVVAWARSRPASP